MEYFNIGNLFTISSVVGAFGLIYRMMIKPILADAKETKVWRKEMELRLILLEYKEENPNADSNGLRKYLLS